MRIAYGTVLLVQEGRFAMQTGQGTTQLFVLSHRAAAEPQQLAELQRRQSRVRVRYREAERGMSAVAHEIDLLED